MFELFFRIIKHDCKYDARQIRGGDQWAKFYIERVCRKCGVVQHKDLRQASANKWMEGSYVGRKPRPTDNGGVILIKTELDQNKRYKR